VIFQQNGEEKEVEMVLIREGKEIETPNGNDEKVNIVKKVK